MSVRIAAASLLLLLFLGVARGQETLPPFHWVNGYVDYLKVRGFLPELAVSERPYSRQALARQLLEIDLDRLSGTEKAMVRLLYREFTGEFRQLGTLPDSKWGILLQKALEVLKLTLLDAGDDPAFKLGAYGATRYDYSDDAGSGDTNFDFHSQIGLFWKDYFTLYNSMKVFDQADENYIGKEYRDFYAYTQQGYAAYQNGWLQAKLGRDFLQIGPGRGGQLLISDNSRTFDMYQVRLGNRTLQFSFWGIMLDRTTQITGGNRMIGNRFLNGHRISLNLGDKIHLGASEVILYSGEARQWELGFINPVTLYYAHNVNQEPGAAQGNLLYNIDWDLYLWPNLEIYGEIMLDDIQVDRKTPGDLEPDEYGLLLGLHWARPLGAANGLLNLEYTQVRNRTYNVATPVWDKYLHRNEEIGHYLGNNFERIDLSYRHWLRPELNLRLFGSLTRQGEGSVAGAFNNDFLNSTVEEGYDEAFPFGVVERTWESGLGLFYKPYPAGHVSLDLAYQDIKNPAHQDGSAFSDITVRLGLWLQWNRLWKW